MKVIAKLDTQKRISQKELADYKSETLAVILGQSKMGIDLLNTLVAETEVQTKKHRRIQTRQSRLFVSAGIIMMCCSQ